MKYDYSLAVKDDVKNEICEYLNMEEGSPELSAYISEHRSELEEKLHDDLWNKDSVTGNASGSYTMSTWQAEENLCHNWDLLEETAFSFGDEHPYISTDYKYGAEFWDVSIRLYLLPSAISEALDELEQKGGDI